MDIASFSSPRDMLSGANLLHVNGFIHRCKKNAVRKNFSGNRCKKKVFLTAVGKTSLEAWLPIPGLALTWTKLVGPFGNSDFVKAFLAQSPPTFFCLMMGIRCIQEIPSISNKRAVVSGLKCRGPMEVYTDFKIFLEIIPCQHLNVVCTDSAAHSRCRADAACP